MSPVSVNCIRTFHATAETGDIFTQKPVGRFGRELHHATTKNMGEALSRVASQLKHYEQAQFQHYRSK